MANEPTIKLTVGEDMRLTMEPASLGFDSESNAHTFSIVQPEWLDGYTRHIEFKSQDGHEVMYPIVGDQLTVPRDVMVEGLNRAQLVWYDGGVVIRKSSIVLFRVAPSLNVAEPDDPGSPDMVDEVLRAKAFTGATLDGEALAFKNLAGNQVAQITLPDTTEDLRARVFAEVQIDGNELSFSNLAGDKVAEVTLPEGNTGGDLTGDLVIDRDNDSPGQNSSYQVLFQAGPDGADTFRHASIRLRLPSIYNAQLQILNNSGLVNVALDESGYLRVRDSIYATNRIFLGDAATDNAASIGFCFVRWRGYGGKTITLQSKASPDTTGGMQWLNSSNTAIAAVDDLGNFTGLTFSETSDYRLKDNIVPVDTSNALARVLALKPVDFTWKNSGTASRGFLAHEVAENEPNAIQGEKDAMTIITSADDAGNVTETEVIAPQTLNMVPLVADLVAAVQFLTARVVELEQAVQAAKGA